MKGFIKQNKWLMTKYYSGRFIWDGNKRYVSGQNNLISHYGASLQDVIIDIRGNHNIVEICETASLKNCRIQIRGDHHKITLGHGTIFSRCNFSLEDYNGTIMIGNRTTMGDFGEIAAVEPDSIVQIGEDCMFSTHVDIRNTDSHSILDMHTGKRINPGKKVVIGDRVWIGAYVQVLKGVVIGNDSIVGIRSLVTKEIPSNCVAVGVPAKVIKTQVNWCKERL